MIIIIYKLIKYYCSNLFGFSRRHIVCFLISPIKAKVSHFSCLILSLGSTPLIKTAFPSKNEAFKIKNKDIECTHFKDIPTSKKGLWMEIAAFLIEIYCNFNSLGNTFRPLFLTFFVSKANSFNKHYKENNTWVGVDMEFTFKLNTKREIPDLHRDTIALYWQEKPTSLMNENKWIDSPRITIVRCVGDSSQERTMRWIMIMKTTMGVIFNLQNSHLLTNTFKLAKSD